MLTQPYDKVVKFITDHPASIYVWVDCGCVNGFPTRRTINISQWAALDWCREVNFEKERNGKIPCFIDMINKNIILGTIESLI